MQSADSLSLAPHSQLPSPTSGKKKAYLSAITDFTIAHCHRMEKPVVCQTKRQYDIMLMNSVDQMND